MSEENIRQEFRLKNIDEAKTYLIEEINQNQLMSKKHKKFDGVLNYLEHLLIAISTVTACTAICFFSWHSYGIMSSAIGLKNCVITAGIKNHKSIIKKNKKMLDKIFIISKI